jgi:hypothetical protein
MAEKNSTLLSSSRYTAGGQTEVNSSALEWWERTQFQTDETDLIYVVDSLTAGRIDLIAAAYYGEDKWSMWWLIAQYNAILDPEQEVSVGRVLRIPTKSRAQQLMQGRLGGYTSTRTVPTNPITPIV